MDDCRFPEAYSKVLESQFWKTLPKDNEEVKKSFAFVQKFNEEQIAKDMMRVYDEVLLKK